MGHSGDQERQWGLSRTLLGPFKHRCPGGAQVAEPPWGLGGSLPKAPITRSWACGPGQVTSLSWGDGRWEPLCSTGSWGYVDWACWTQCLPLPHPHSPWTPKPLHLLFQSVVLLLQPGQLIGCRRHGLGAWGGGKKGRVGSAQPPGAPLSCPQRGFQPLAQGLGYSRCPRAACCPRGWGGARRNTTSLEGLPQGKGLVLVGRTPGTLLITGRRQRRAGTPQPGGLGSGGAVGARGGHGAQGSLRRKTCCRFWRRALSNSCCFFLASSWVTMQRSHRPARSLRGEEGKRAMEGRGPHRLGPHCPRSACAVGAPPGRLSVSCAWGLGRNLESTGFLRL